MSTFQKEGVFHAAAGEQIMGYECHANIETHTETYVWLVLVRPTGCKGCGSLTTVIQHKVVLGIAKLLWSARYEDIIIPEEVLQAGDLETEE